MNDSLDDFVTEKPKVPKRKFLQSVENIYDEPRSSAPKKFVGAVGLLPITPVRTVGIQVNMPRAMDEGASYKKKIQGGKFTFRMLLEVVSCKEWTLNFCFENGLIPRKRSCPTCQSDMSLINDRHISDGKRWYCRQRKGPNKHEKRLSIRTGTFFENSNMTLEEVLQFVYLWVHGTPLDMIHHELGLSSNTDVDWANFLREVMEMAMSRKSCQIGGPGVVVEIDESKFAKRKYNRGHPVKTGWVFGGRERDNKKKVFMVSVPDRTAETLIALIKKWIAPGSIIWSDCWRAYNQIPKLPEGYSHYTVNHSVTFKDKETGVCTNRIESDWGKAKATLPRFGRKEDHLPGFLATFMWKRFHEGDDQFMELVREISICYPGMVE